MRITAPQARQRERGLQLEEATATVRALSCLSKLYFSVREDVTRGSGVLAEAKVAQSLSCKFSYQICLQSSSSLSPGLLQGEVGHSLHLYLFSQEEWGC